MSQRAVVGGLHVCEQIIIDSNSRNVTAVNCFTRRTIETGAGGDSFWVFAVLTDGQGRLKGAVEIERLDTGETIFAKEFSLRLESPLQQLRLMLRVRGVNFPQPGAYQVMLKVENDLVASRRFILTES